MLQGLLAATSLFGALGNEKRANSAANASRKSIDDANRVAGDSYRQTVENYQRRKAEGAYDAMGLMEQLTNQAERATRVGGGNITARYGNAGYKPGDSNVNQSLRHFSEKGQLDLAQQLLAAKDLYSQRESQDQAGVAQAGNTYANILRGIGGDYQQQQPRGAGLAQTLSGLGGMDFGGLFKMSSGGGGTTNGPAQGPPDYKRILNTIGGIHL